MVRVSADKTTREQLGINDDEVTDFKARQICEKIADDRNFKAGLSNDKLVIQRFLRDWVIWTNEFGVRGIRWCVFLTTPLGWWLEWEKLTYGLLPSAYGMWYEDRGVTLG
jgi:hypothetical protein